MKEALIFFKINFGDYIMIVIKTTSQDLAKKAEAVMEMLLLKNINFNGEQYIIEAGDFNEINGIGGYAGRLLYCMIFND